jgi:hypothetical protein
MVDVELIQVPPINIVSIPVDPIEVFVEQIPPTELIPLHNVGGFGTRFTKILGNVFTVTVLQTEHMLASPIGVLLFMPDGTNVDVDWKISGTTIVMNSNVNLLNHKIIIY